MSVNRSLAVVWFVILASILGVQPSNAHSKADLFGAVIDKTVIMGPQGSPNQIDLIINTLDGLLWAVVCKRSQANLGFCNSIDVGDVVAVYDYVANSQMIGCYGTINPTRPITVVQ